MDKIYLKRLLFYFCIFHYCSFSIALQKIADTPKPSESTCTIRDAIFRSGYVKKCNLLPFDSHLRLCKFNNVDECFCNAINETAHEICKLQINFDAKFDFDDELTKLQNIVKPNAFCNYTMNLVSNKAYRDRFQPTDSFPIIVQLNELLRTKCSKICFGWDDTINWFCSALVTVDTLLVENLHLVKSTSPKTSVSDTKRKISLPTNSQAEKSNQSKPISRKSENQDRVNEATAERLDTDSRLQASKPANSSDIKSTQQKNDEQTQGSPPKDQRAGTIPETPTKIKSGSNDLPEPPASDPQTVIHTNSEKVSPVPRTAPTVSTTESPQPENPPESDPEHEDDFDGESDLGSVGSDDGNNHLEKPIVNDAEKTVSPKKKEDDIIRPNSPIRDQIIDVQEESHLFVYFMALSLISIIAYIGFHNKHKIFAIVLEGKPSRGGRSRRRPNTAGYRKLDCNLEEAVTSQCNSNVTHVIY